MDDNVVKDRVRQLAEETGNLTKFADIAGVTRRSVTYWLSGEWTPSSECVYNLAKAFNVTADWILGITDNRAPIHKTIAEIESGAERERKGFLSRLFGAK